MKKKFINDKNSLKRSLKDFDKRYAFIFYINYENGVSSKFVLEAIELHKNFNTLEEVNNYLVKKVNNYRNQMQYQVHQLGFLYANSIRDLIYQGVGIKNAQDMGEIYNLPEKEETSSDKTKDKLH
jgi:hypothetical protein